MPIDGARVFELTARGYDWLTRQSTWRAHCRELAHELGVANGSGPRRVLDLGVGPGVSAFAVHDVWPDCHCIGVDLSPKMLERAGRLAARETGRLDLVQADAAELPFPDAHFDAMVAHSFLYLVPEPDRVMQEAARVLAPGARMAMLEPRDGGHLRDILRAHPTKARFGASMMAWRVASRNFGRWTESRLTSVIEEAGFGDVRMRATLEGLGWLVTAVRVS